MLAHGRHLQHAVGVRGLAEPRHHSAWGQGGAAAAQQVTLLLPAAHARDELCRGGGGSGGRRRGARSGGLGCGLGGGLDGGGCGGCGGGGCRGGCGSRGGGGSAGSRLEAMALAAAAGQVDSRLLRPAAVEAGVSPRQLGVALLEDRRPARAGAAGEQRSTVGAARQQRVHGDLGPRAVHVEAERHLAGGGEGCGLTDKERVHQLRSAEGKRTERAEKVAVAHCALVDCER